ncbi:MAG: fluoride efflux transporter CrcB [Muribaculum sp.]|nr:fluoride efflux transporter CrcB [Muribaculum sp.]
MQNLFVYLYVFVGGGIGSLLRYLLQIAMHEKISIYNFPWATFAVNIIGCFLIGLCYALSEKYNFNHELRLLLTAGFCGGFTTFSTFSYDNLELMRQGHWGLCLTYIILSIFIGILSCIGGVYVGTSR